MTVYTTTQKNLTSNPCTWLITGVAGFIGSNLLEALLKLNQRVVGLDNFATGFQHNLDEVQSLVTTAQWKNFNFLCGDIRNPDDCRLAMTYTPSGKSSESTNRASMPVEFVLHEAALGSVPRSIENPINTNDTNITGFLNILVAARDAKVKRLVYAASSSTYSDHPGLPKKEDIIGKPLSPYAVTKYVNELYADVFAQIYGLNTIGLRYFNVFGKHQTPDGAYAAVIPKWISSLIKNEPVFVNGDGETSRDFCYIKNVVQINLLAATSNNPEALNQIYNVAVGDRTTLNELYEDLRVILLKKYPYLDNAKPVYRDFRSGDVRDSLANIAKAKKLLGYAPQYRVGEGLRETMPWYVTPLEKKVAQ